MARTANTQTRPIDRAVREPERRQITGVGRAGWTQAERRGVVPRRRMQPGLRAAYWLESELLAWIRGEWRPSAIATPE